MSLEETIKQIVIDTMKQNQLATIPELLTAEEVEIETNGKIKKERVWELARNADNNNFPVVRTGKRDVKVLKSDFVEWLKSGGLK